MNFLLSDYHLSRQEEFRRFAEEEIDTGNHFPRENLQKAGECGYMGLPLPKGWGGQDEDFLTYILLIEEVSKVCAATGAIIAVHTSLGSFPLLYFGTEEQKKHFLPALARGEILGAFALTEEGSGSDAAALTSTAVAEEGGYRLNGSKMFITSGGEADLYTLLATIDRDLGHKGITAFLVEGSSPGLSAGKSEKKMGLNRASTSELVMEDLFVPASNRLGKEGEGFYIALSLLDGGRIGIGAQGLGLARASIEYATAYLKEAEKTGKKTEQAVSFVLADLATRLEAARLLVYRAAVAKDSGEKCSREASMAKYYATDLAMEAASRCIDLCGYQGGKADNPLTMYFCDAKAPQIYEGTNQIQRMVVARELLNI
ncbi:MAG: acyl-CoA dehydrogenase family protein [Bacillota bacterium]